MNGIHIVDEYPIPFDEEELVAMQEEQVGEPYGLSSEDDVIQHSCAGLYTSGFRIGLPRLW